MSIQTIVRSGRLYVRTELLVAEMRLRSYARKAALLAVALGVALFGLGMLNVAAFLWLSETFGPVATALGIAAANFAVAAAAGVTGLVTGAVELGAARLLMPTVGALVGGLRKKKQPETAKEAPAANRKR